MKKSCSNTVSEHALGETVWSTTTSVDELAEGRIVDGESGVSEFFVDVGVLLEADNFVISEGNDVAPLDHTVVIICLDEFDTLLGEEFLEPGFESGLEHECLVLGEHRDKAVHVSVVLWVRDGNSSPALLLEELGDLECSLVLTADSAVPEESETWLDDDEVSSLEMSGADELEDFDSSFLVEADDIGVFGFSGFELHRGDDGPPGGHEGVITGEEVSGHIRVTFDFVHLDLVIDEDLFEGLVLSEAFFEVESVGDFALVGQESSGHGSGIGPSEILGGTQDDGSEFSVVTITAELDSTCDSWDLFHFFFF